MSYMGTWSGATFLGSLFATYVPDKPTNTGTFYLGVKFTIGAADINAVGVGRFCFVTNSLVHTIGIIRASDSTVLGTATLDATGLIGFKYVTLPSGIILKAGQTYIAASSESTDVWNDDAPVTPSSSAITIVGSVYSTTGITGPYTTGRTGNFSFGTDMQFTT